MHVYFVPPGSMNIASLHVPIINPGHLLSTSQGVYQVHICTATLIMPSWRVICLWRSGSIVDMSLSKKMYVFILKTYMKIIIQAFDFLGKTPICSSHCLPILSRSWGGTRSQAFRKRAVRDSQDDIFEWMKSALASALSRTSSIGAI